MFNFSRRINRRTYFGGAAFSLIPFVAISVFVELTSESDSVGLGFLIFLLIYITFLFVYWLCLMRQRCNDISPRPLLILLVAVLVPFGSLVIGLLPSVPSPNKFGPVPEPVLKLR